MTPEEREVLKLLQSWSPDVTTMLKRAGYFNLPEGTQKAEIAYKVGFGPGTPLFKKLKAASMQKNSQVAKIVLNESTLLDLKQGAREVAKSLGIPFSEYDWNPIAQKYMKDEGFTLVKTLTRTDLKRLVPQIQRHFGLNERTFQKQFAQDYPCAPYRMRTIFRTEKFNAINGGSHLEAKSVDATTKIWRHSHGPNPRKDHLAMDGQEREIDEAFSNGKQYPSGMPNCRCRADYRFDGVARAKATAKNTQIDFSTTPNKVKVLEASIRGASFSVDEKKVIEGYTGSWYKGMNEYLLKGPGDWYAPAKTIEKRISDLSNALAKAPLKEDITVHSGISSKSWDRLLSSMPEATKEGTKLKYDGFLSTTLDKDVATWFSPKIKGSKQSFLELRLPKGTNASYVKDLSITPEEKEVIVDKGIVFHVVGIREEKNARVMIWQAMPKK